MSRAHASFRLLSFIRLFCGKVGSSERGGDRRTDGRDDVTVRNGGGQYSALGEKGNRGQETTVLSRAGTISITKESQLRLLGHF